MTIVAVGGERSKEVCYRPGTDMMTETRHDLGGADVIIFIEINAIFRRVVTALGHDPVKVMRLAQQSLDAVPQSGFMEA